MPLTCILYNTTPALPAPSKLGPNAKVKGRGLASVFGDLFCVASPTSLGPEVSGLESSAQLAVTLIDPRNQEGLGESCVRRLKYAQVMTEIISSISSKETTLAVLWRTPDNIASMDGWINLVKHNRVMDIWIPVEQPNSNTLTSSGLVFFNRPELELRLERIELFEAKGALYAFIENYFISDESRTFDVGSVFDLFSEDDRNLKIEIVGFDESNGEFGTLKLTARYV